MADFFKNCKKKKNCPNFSHLLVHQMLFLMKVFLYLLLDVQDNILVFPAVCTVLHAHLPRAHPSSSSSSSSSSAIIVSLFLCCKCFFFSSGSFSLSFRLSWKDLGNRWYPLKNLKFMEDRNCLKSIILNDLNYLQNKQKEKKKGGEGVEVKSSIPIYAW